MSKEQGFCECDRAQQAGGLGEEALHEQQSTNYIPHLFYTVRSCLGESVAPVPGRHRDVREGLVQQRLLFSVGF